jgi:ribonuclease PH
MKIIGLHWKAAQGAGLIPYDLKPKTGPALGQRGLSCCGITNCTMCVKSGRLRCVPIRAVVPSRMERMTDASSLFFRQNGRSPSELRSFSLTPDYVRTAEGSVLIAMGETRVLCNASVEVGVPGWMRGQGRGWVTAEYGMLPRATLTRSARESERGKVSGRTHEIQRLIGRSLRAGVDMEALGERTVILDCDVLQADGGTRTAAITGACAALALALGRMTGAGALKLNPMQQLIAAVSVGVVEGATLLDLAYEEDSQAEVDANVVISADGGLIEVQATAERKAFPRSGLMEMLDLADMGLRQLFAAQRAMLVSCGLAVPGSK